MVLDAVSNFVRGTADAAIASGDSTISVTDASIFPDPATDGEFNVVIWNANNFPRPDQDADVEIVRVTARDTGTNELTVTRAQEMTSAAAHPNGSAIHLSPTAKMFSDIEGTFADFWNADTQQLTADVNNTNTTTEALEAGSATVGEGTGDPSTFAGMANFENGLSLLDYPINRLETKTDADEDNDVISFDGLEQKRYGLFLDDVLLNEPELEMYFEDRNSEADYSYYDEAGTRSDEENTITLIDVGGGVVVRGWVIIDNIQSSSGNKYTGFKNNFVPGRTDRINGWADRGGIFMVNDSFESPVNSVQLENPSLSTSGTEIELWEML